jgi:tRNA (guanosine-2'-O-)-methyltransferase
MRVRKLEEALMERAGPRLDEELSAWVRHRPTQVCRALGPLLSDARRARIDGVVRSRLPTVVVVLDQLMDPHNRAAILRTAEGFGLLEVHAIEEDGDWPLSRRVTQGCHKWLDVFVHRHAESCAELLLARGFQLLEATEKGRTSATAAARHQKLAVCLGNEHAGLSPALRQYCTGSVSVPMVGFTKSLNVSVAGALLLAQLVENRSRGLPKGDHDQLRARYYVMSVRNPLEVLRREDGHWPGR